MKEVMTGEISKTTGEDQKVKQDHDNNTGSAGREEVMLGMRRQSARGSHSMAWLSPPICPHYPPPALSTAPIKDLGLNFPPLSGHSAPLPPFCSDPARPPRLLAIALPLPDS